MGGGLLKINLSLNFDSNSAVDYDDLFTEHRKSEIAYGTSKNMVTSCPRFCKAVAMGYMEPMWLFPSGIVIKMIL